MVARLLTVLALAAQPAAAIYLPGIAPTDYHKDDLVPVTVNSLSSPNSVVSHNYYDMGFCTPAKIQSQPESLGSLLFGDRIYNSPIEVSNTCKAAGAET
jgi:transmembrane 9 superfamily protein 2/4